VPLEALAAQAAASRKRLVLCGHSLGGAVALLCTVKLLRAWAAARLGGGYAAAAAAGGGGRPLNDEQLAAAAAAAAAAPYADPDIRCITFAAPAVANEALAAEVVASGWDCYISNFVQPGELPGWWWAGVGCGGTPGCRSWGGAAATAPGGARCGRGRVRRQGRVGRRARSATVSNLHAIRPPFSSHCGIEDVIVPFVNKLLKAEAGSAALQRTLKRLAAAHAAAAVASAAAARRGGGGGRAVLVAAAAAGTPPGSSRSSSWSSGCSRSGVGSFGPVGGSSFTLRALQIGERTAGLFALPGALGRAAAAAAAAAASAAGSAAAAAAALAQGSAAELQSSVLQDSACRHTAAVVSLAMASAVRLPAAETLGNAPHRPEAARRLLRSSDSVLTLRDASLGGGASDGGASGGGALRPAKQLQGGLSVKELVVAADAGVIGLSEAELCELPASDRARLSGSGWSAWWGAAASEVPCAASATSGCSSGPGTAGASTDTSAGSSIGGGYSSGGCSGGGCSGGGCSGGGCSACGSVGGCMPPSPRSLPATPCARLAPAAEGDESDAPVTHHNGQAGADACPSEEVAVPGTPATGVPHERNGPDALRRRRLEPVRRTHSAFECAIDARRSRMGLDLPQDSAYVSRSGGGGGAGGAAAKAAPGAISKAAGCSDTGRLGARASWSFTMLSCPDAWQQQHTAFVQMRAAALLQRRGPSLKERLLWNAARAALLAAPKLAAAAAAALPARALLPAPQPPAGALAGLCSVLSTLLLALPPAAVVFELVCGLVVVFIVPRTYTIGTQWVLTRAGMEPALRPLNQYPRDWDSLKWLGGLWPGHRMCAYRARINGLLPAERLRHCASYRALAKAAAAEAEQLVGPGS
jgi:hypothetical protein